ncbi:transposase domain-containing protein, partial [bacterium]|nr:transposase domain-containing protein [bacterium]
LYFRETRLPAGETFATKTTLAAAMLRAADADAAAPVLAVCDGAYANTSVNPWAYLRDLFDRLPAVPAGADLSPFLPDT